MSHIKHHADEDTDCDDDDPCREWTRAPPDLFTEQVCPDSENGRPAGRPECIEQQESRPRHLISAGKHGCKGPQQRNEPSNEHDLSAMADEQIAPEFETCFSDVHISS